MKQYIESSIRWQKKNPERMQIKCRKYYYSHKYSPQDRIRVNEQKRQWAKRTGKEKIYGQVQRFRKKVAGILTVKILQKVYEDNIKVFGTLTCIYCFSQILFGNDTLEHILPISRSGTNKFRNLGIACQRCNCSKGDKTLEEFFEERR